jgi:hypothetical protein
MFNIYERTLQSLHPVPGIFNYRLIWETYLLIACCKNSKEKQEWRNAKEDDTVQLVRFTAVVTELIDMQLSKIQQKLY